MKYYISRPLIIIFLLNFLLLSTIAANSSKVNVLFHENAECGEATEICCCENVPAKDDHELKKQDCCEIKTIEINFETLLIKSHNLNSAHNIHFSSFSVILINNIAENISNDFSKTENSDMFLTSVTCLRI